MGCTKIHLHRFSAYKNDTDSDKPYAQIVRAASHCLATCHVPTHAEGTAMYLVSAIKLIYKEKDEEYIEMQIRAYYIYINFLDQDNTRIYDARLKDIYDASIDNNSDRDYKRWHSEKMESWGEYYATKK